MTGFYQSPIGIIKIVVCNTGIIQLDFIEDLLDINKQSENNLIVQNCINQLDEYFTSKRKTFDLPFSQSGTEFQKKVWNKLQEIPYGTTWTYGDVAKAIGHPNSYRAVGTANGNNQIPIIVPCHRVIGANNKLSGYAFGVERKKWLINHEKYNFTKEK